MQKKANSASKPIQKTKPAASVLEVKALPSGSPSDGASDPIEAALASLLASESVWRKPTLADTVAAHLPSIKSLIERRCPIDKIAAAMISSGVDAKKTTLVRAIQMIKNGSGKTPKKGGAVSKRMHEKPRMPAEQNSEESKRRLAYFCPPLNDDEGPSDDEGREATDSTPSVTDILGASLSAS